MPVNPAPTELRRPKSPTSFGIVSRGGSQAEISNLLRHSFPGRVTKWEKSLFLWTISRGAGHPEECFPGHLRRQRAANSHRVYGYVALFNRGEQATDLLGHMGTKTLLFGEAHPANLTRNHICLSQCRTPQFNFFHERQKLLSIALLIPPNRKRSRFSADLSPQLWARHETIDRRMQCVRCRGIHLTVAAGSSPKNPAS